MEMDVAGTLDRWRPKPLVSWSLTLAGIAIIGGFDYLSGTELRVYPLYYAPISFFAWYERRTGAVVASIASTAVWVASNVFAGLEFSHPALWVANAAVHGGSFLLVGLIIAILHRAMSEARSLSRTDPLTSLLNSRAFYEDAVPLLSLCRRHGRPVTLAYIDLDHFKTVNDRYGHSAGDALLGDIADAIRRTVRPSDLCARLGGDEFAILLPELAETEAATVLDRVRESVVSAAKATDPAVTASVGGVTFAAAPLSLETLVHHADELMYSAKAAGRNRVTFEVRNHAIPLKPAQAD